MIRSIACLILVPLLVGCGGDTGGADRPETVPVTGSVTYNGQPVEGATVTFVAGASEGRGALGTTDASGKFQLTTFEAGDGAIPGSYKVTVAKTTGDSGPMTQEDGVVVPPTGGPPTTEVKDELPVKYKDASTSGLTADVQEGQDNEFTFDLTD